jgi:predicted  nucleic acid-binding Zn-ribbon protein
MSTDQGFVDLRLNRQEGQINESFWPSFTDIMTVIVMIFLIAMVVLLMRNMELVAELRATMEAERVASELARATGQEKDSLSMQLHAAQDRVSAMQLELMRLRERNLAQETTITDQTTQIADLTAERDKLAQQTAQLTLLRQRLETDLDSANVRLERAQQNIANLESNVAGLEQNLQNLQGRFESAQASASELQQTVREQQQQLEGFRSERQEAERKYLVLVGEYDDLKVKYDKLVKPARSPKGRRLVEVRYWKDGGYRIAYREGSEGPFTEVSRADLDQRLSALRDGEPNGLYVKVIFPESSGLSYNEAWEFTSHLHRNYDYYFQEGGDVDEALPQDNAEPPQ